MRSLLVLPTLALATAAFAQQPVQGAVQSSDSKPAQPTILQSSAVMTNCPVALQALKTKQWGSMVQVDRNAQPHGLALNIVLRALGKQPIQQAHVILTGISGGHLLPADSGTAGDVSEDFTITNGSTPKAQLESVVYTKHLIGIRTVSLTEITWSDGTTWHATPGSACRITPSLYLEVNAMK